MNDIQKIIGFIDKYLEDTGKEFLTPPEANKLLDQAGILKDRPNRSGKYLRDYLRDGKIPHAYQVSGYWRIPHS
jgi:hypothetical protein